MPPFKDNASKAHFCGCGGGHEARRTCTDDDEICVEIHIHVENSGKVEKTLFI